VGPARAGRGPQGRRPSAGAGAARAARRLDPEWYSDEFGRLLKRAGLRRITLHDSRHTILTLMEQAGMPISIISKWAGHYDSAFTQKTYVHASDEDLQRGQAALARIHRIL
jgi:integrase